MRRTESPRRITVKYAAKCAETGRDLPKGSTAIYYPSARKLYCEESRQAEEFREMEFSRAWGMADADW